MTSTDNYYIGKGSFGCVYNDIVKCVPPQHLNSNRKYISKLVNYDAFLLEYENLKIAKQLDPKGNFHSLLFGVCTELENIKDLEYCDSINYSDSVAVLYLEYVGIPISKFIKNNVKDFTEVYFDIFEKLAGIINFIVILSKNNFIHYDISINNVLIDSDLKLIRLIDFGTMISFQNIENTSVKSIKYPFRPPDIILSKTPFPSKVVYNKFIQDYVSDCKQYSFTSNLFSSSILSLSNNKHVETLYSLYDKYSKLSHEDRQKIICPKIDVYSFGITCLNILEQLKEKRIRLHSEFKTWIYQIVSYCTIADPEDRTSPENLFQIYLQALNIT